MNFNYCKTIAMAVATLGASIALSENICGQTQAPVAGSSAQKSADAAQHVSRAHAFILENANDNKLEIALGQLAQIRAENPQVRQFAQELAREHAMANQQLQSLGQQQRVPIDFTAFMQMTQASGAQFDQAYVRYLLQDNETVLQHLREIAEKHPDRSVQQFARDYVVQLENQLQQVQKVAGQVQAGGSIQEPAGAEPSTPQAAAPTSQQQHYSSVLQQRAEGRHYPEPSGRIITEQAGAESSRELMQQVQRLEQQVQQLQQQVQQLQGQQGGPSSAHMPRAGQAPRGTTSGMPMPQSEDFVKIGAAHSKLCVALSQVAMERAQRPEVRQLAQTQLESAQQASQRLAQLGQQYGTPMDAEQVRQLVQMSGSQFDQAYVRFVVEEHGRAIADLRRAAEDQSTPTVQQFAKGQLPQMEGHLAHARLLQNAIQNAGGVREPAGAQPEQYRDLRELLRP